MPSTFSLLGTIKCSTCGAGVDIAELGDHVCAPPKPKPEEPATALPLAKSCPNPADPSRQGKPNLPPIDSQAANRPFFGPRGGEAAQNSSSSGSQESPTTPADGQPLSGPMSNGHARAHSNPRKSLGTNKDRLGAALKRVDESPRSSLTNEQHLYALPQDSSLFAPVSSTTDGGKSLMARMNTIAPGPFGVGSSHERTPSRANTTDSRPTRGEEGWGSKRESGAGSRRESSERARMREEAERKLTGSRSSAYSRESSRSTTDMRPLTSGSDRRPPTSGSERRPPTSGSERRLPTSSSFTERRPATSGSVRSVSSKRSLSTDSSRSIRRQAQEIPPLPKTQSVEESHQLPQPSVEVNKPPASPSYQAYRPAQPVQRLPPSPRLPEFKYRRPAPRGYDSRSQDPANPPPDLPVHPNGLLVGPGPHSRNPSSVSLQPIHRQPSPGPSAEQADAQGAQFRRPGKAYEDSERIEHPMRNQSRSPISGQERQLRRPSPPERRPSRDDYLPAGLPPAQRRPSRDDHLPSNALSPLPDWPRKSENSGSSGMSSEASSRNNPPHGHNRSSPSRSSVDLGEIDGLMKDLQVSMKNLSQPSPVLEEPKGSNETKAVAARKRDMPPKKATAKSNCRGCGEPIQGKGLTSSDGRLTGRYHKQCFVCQACREPFASSTFYVWEDLPYCARHYHELNNSLCKRCDNGIEGPCLETEKRDRFHPECFTCVECRTVLGEDYFELNGRPYCERHAHKRMQMNARLGPGRSMGNMERRRTRLMMM